MPLTTSMVVCHRATFSLFMYEMPDSVPFTSLSLLVVLGVIGWNHLISSALWPNEPELWPGFDANYLAHRRFSWWGVLMIALLVEIARGIYGLEVTLAPGTPGWLVETADWANIVGSVTLIAMPFIRSTRLALVLVAVMVAHSRCWRRLRRGYRCGGWWGWRWNASCPPRCG